MNMSKRMTMTMGEWVSYLRNVPEEVYFDDVCILFMQPSGVTGIALDEDTNCDEDALSLLDPSLMLTLDCGDVYSNGQRNQESLESSFLAWRKARAVISVVMDVPRERASELAELLSKAGFDVPGNLSTTIAEVAAAPVP